MQIVLLQFVFVEVRAAESNVPPQLLSCSALASGLYRLTEDSLLKLEKSFARKLSKVSDEVLLSKIQAHMNRTKENVRVYLGLEKGYLRGLSPEWEVETPQDLLVPQMVSLTLDNKLRPEVPIPHVIMTLQGSYNLFKFGFFKQSKSLEEKANFLKSEGKDLFIDLEFLLYLRELLNR